RLQEGYSFFVDILRRMLAPSTGSESQYPRAAAAVIAEPVVTSATPANASRCIRNPASTNPAPIAIRVYLSLSFMLHDGAMITSRVGGLAGSPRSPASRRCSKT